MPVGEANPSHLTQSGVRLFRGGCVNPYANTTAHRATSESRRLTLGLEIAPPFFDNLANCRHVFQPFSNQISFLPLLRALPEVRGKYSYQKGPHLATPKPYSDTHFNTKHRITELLTALNELQPQVNGATWRLLPSDRDKLLHQYLQESDDP